MSGKTQDEKVEYLRGVAYKYSSEWINELETEPHWRCYWWQQKLMQGKIDNDHSLLEIGVGSGFTANYLKSRGFHVTTVDIDAAKGPDVIANVVEWTPPEEYDHVLAFEVFEHIPFEEFERAFQRLSPCCRGSFFFSFPACLAEKVHIAIYIDGIVNRRKSWWRPRPISEGHHFWEVGAPGTTLDDLDAMFARYGWCIADTLDFEHWRFLAVQRA